MEYKEIDYTKLNEQIVKQAYGTLLDAHTLDEEQFHKLISDKFERARQYKEAFDKSPLTY